MTIHYWTWTNHFHDGWKLFHGLITGLIINYLNGRIDYIIYLSYVLSKYQDGLSFLLLNDSTEYRKILNRFILYKSASNLYWNVIVVYRIGTKLTFGWVTKPWEWKMPSKLDIFLHRFFIPRSMNQLAIISLNHITPDGFVTKWSPLSFAFWLWF